MYGVVCVIWAENLVGSVEKQFTDIAASGGNSLIQSTEVVHLYVKIYDGVTAGGGCEVIT